ncbi:MAG: cyclic lactone autoinducer peptide [Bacilli bacterium]|nr:cyclic lactone autoinducer peptide [Bacilli bacterium]
MGKIFSKMLKFFGSVGANAGSVACVVVFLDEPECPKSLIK